MVRWINRIAAAFKTTRSRTTSGRQSLRAIRRPESLERRELLSASPMPTAAAAVATASAPYLPGQPGDGTNQTFVNNVYRELLGRNVDPTGAAYWMNFLAQNTAAQQPLNNGGTAVNDGLGASGFAIGTPALNGAQVEGPNGGYAISEFPQGFGSAAAFPNGNPTSAISTLGPEGPNGGYAGSPMSNVGGTGVFTEGSGYSPALSQNFATGVPVPSANYGVGPNGAATSGLPANGASAGSLASAAFTGATAQNGSPREQMISAILSSPEYQHHLVNAIYQNFLHRAPGDEAVNYWSGQLANSGEQAVLSRIVGSQEYYQDNGGTDAGFINALYRDLLGRSSSAQAQAYWVGQLQTLDQASTTGDGSAARSQIVLDFLSTPEARGLLLNNPTGNALANVTGGGLAQLFYGDTLSSQAQQTVFADFATSPSYEAEINNLITQGAFYDRTLGIGPGPGNNPAAPPAYVV